MENFFQDVKYGFRALLKSSGFAAVAILSLALGIGANTAIFSIISAFLFAPLPVAEPRELVSIFTSDVKNPGNLLTSHLNFIDYREKNDVFTDVAAYTFAQVSLTSATGESKQLFALVTSGNYFDVLGVKPVKGRTFLPDEDKTPGTHPVVVVSYACWQRDFGGDPELVGKSLILNRHDFTVVGIAPKDFNGTDLGDGPDLWVPMSMHEQVQPGFGGGTSFYNTRRGLFLLLFGRLKPGVALAQAQASMSGLGSQLEQEYRKDNEGRNVKLIPLLQARTDPGGDGQLWTTSMLIMGVVGIVLLIACANVTNLLLARATKRRREIAIRLAIGASRARLIKQLMTESLLLSIIGGAVGFFAARWTMGLIRSFVPFGDGPNTPEPAIDSRVLLFTFAITVLSGLLFGLAPALQASRPDLVPTLKGDITIPASRRGLRFNLRQALVVLQVALSVFALITAGLFVRSLQKASTVDPGFTTDSVLVMAFNLGREGYSTEQGKIFHRQVLDRVTSLTGVEAATIARDRPFAGGFQRSVFIEGQEPPPGGRGVLVQTNNIAPRFFDTLGITLLRGRDFSDVDSEKAPRTVIVNEAMANQFWPGQDPLGKRLKLFGDEDYREVVGLARDSKINSLTEQRRPFIYLPLLQEYAAQVNLHVRTSENPNNLIAALRNEIKSIDPSLSVLNVETLSERVHQSLGGERQQATLLGTFGLLALLLASIGLYGVMAYSVAQRTREIGIRMALGAERRDVLGLVLKQGVTLTGVGIVVGLGVAFAATRLIASSLFGVTALDPVTFAVSSLILIVVALAASLIPARRATRIDPMIALRYE